MKIDNNKNLVGQPILKQILDLLPREKFMRLVAELETDRYYKTFYSYDQLILMLFGILSRCDSMSEVCDGMRALAGKLNHLGMEISPAKSTVGDALRNRPEELYRQYYFCLIEHFSNILSVSRKESISFDLFYSFDSTTISLFSNVLKGVGRNPKGDGQKKGGLKVHMIIDVNADTPKFVKVTDAKTHDKKFLQHLNLPAGSMVVFDKAYNHYQQFAKWTEAKVNFVCRLKDNAKYQTIGEPLYEKDLSDNEFGVYRVEHIHINYNDKEDNMKSKTLCLRLVFYKDEKGRYYKFITNNWEITAEEVALIYKYRWTIETSFKKLKQNFQLTYFYSDTENGIKTQIWCTLIAFLLMQVVQALSKSKKAMSTIASLIRIHLISNLNIIWVVTEGRKAYPKSINKRNKSPAFIQTTIFGQGR